MGDPNDPIKDIGSQAVKQVGKVLQDIITRLDDHPIYLFGIASMLLAIVGVLALAFLPSLPLSLTWFPYALLVFGIMLIGLTYLEIPQKVIQRIRGSKPPIGEEGSWPNVKTVKSLSAKLAKLSTTQRQILYVISKNNGIYVFQLSNILKIERDQLVYRCKDLENKGLIEILQLTDLSYQLPDGCKPLFEKITIQKLLNSKKKDDDDVPTHDG